MYHAYFFSLNDDIIDIEKADIICLPTFVADKFLGLFLHPFIFLIKMRDLRK